MYGKLVSFYFEKHLENEPVNVLEPQRMGITKKIGTRLVTKALLSFYMGTFKNRQEIIGKPKGVSKIYKKFLLSCPNSISIVSCK